MAFWFNLGPKAPEGHLENFPLICVFSFLPFLLFLRVLFGVFHNRNSAFWPSGYLYHLICLLTFQGEQVGCRTVKKKGPARIARPFVSLCEVWAKFCARSPIEGLSAPG